MKNILIILGVLVVIAGGVVVFRAGSGQPVPSATPTVSVAASVAPTGSAVHSATPTPAGGASTFTTAQVALHNSRASCYSIIRGSVYDLTSYIDKHPGGPQKILSICGRDGTTLFVNKHGGSAPQENMLATLKIGVVTQ